MKKKQHDDYQPTGDSPPDRIPDRRDHVSLFRARNSNLASISGELTVEDRKEEIVAFRGWNLTVTAGNTYSLKSPSRGNTSWPKRRPFKSECVSIPLRTGRKALRSSQTPLHSPPAIGHASPHDLCWCGAYGLKFGFKRALGGILGEVYLFGDYVEHTSGFRAQYAYPKSLTRFRCHWCLMDCTMNSLLIRRISSHAPQGRVHQACISCIAELNYGIESDLIPLSYVIEKLEYEYNLEVGP